MQKIILSVMVLIYSVGAIAQNTFKAEIKDAESKEVLTGATATLQGTAIGSSADQNGYIEIKNIPDGKQIIIFRYMGYQERTDTIIFPYVQTEPLEIFAYARRRRDGGGDCFFDTFQQKY